MLFSVVIARSISLITINARFLTTISVLTVLSVRLTHYHRIVYYVMKQLIPYFLPVLLFNSKEGA